MCAYHIKYIQHNVMEGTIYKIEKIKDQKLIKNLIETKYKVCIF